MYEASLSQRPIHIYTHNGLALVYVYNGHAVRASRKCRSIHPSRVAARTCVSACSILKIPNSRRARRTRTTILPPRIRSRRQAEQYKVQPRAQATTASGRLPLRRQQRTHIRATPAHDHELPRSIRRGLLLHLPRGAVQQSVPVRDRGVVLRELERLLVLHAHEGVWRSGEAGGD